MRRETIGISKTASNGLNVAFREEDQRLRTGNGPQNRTVFCHAVLNLLKQELSVKGGIQVKRRRAGGDNDYLLEVFPIADRPFLLSSV